MVRGGGGHVFQSDRTQLAAVVRIAKRHEAVPARDADHVWFPLWSTRGEYHVGNVVACTPFDDDGKVLASGVGVPDFNLVAAAREQPAIRAVGDGPEHAPTA